MCGIEVPDVASDALGVPKLLRPTVEHRVPKVKRGTGCRCNLDLAHAGCNFAKAEQNLPLDPSLVDALRRSVLASLRQWGRPPRADEGPSGGVLHRQIVRQRKDTLTDA